MDKKPKTIKTKVFQKLPINGNKGKSNLTAFKKKKGIYKILERGELVYVGSSNKDLYKTIMRHFYKWDDERQKRRVSYYKKLGKFRYDVVITLYPDNTDPAKIWSIEDTQIKKHNPRDNKYVYYSQHQRKHYKYRKLEKAVKEYKECENCALEIKTLEPKYSFNANNELLDENGNVLF